MQLDVLSVSRLPASQAGPFILQDRSNVKLQGIPEHQRRGFACLPACAWFTCSRGARYAAGGDGVGVQFSLVKQTAKPSAWVLHCEDASPSGVVRVEQLRGHPHQRPPLPAPTGWPADELLRLGLPPTFDRDEPLEEGSAALSGVASCHVVMEPPEGLAAPREVLVAHAYWRHSCPGKLVLAVARLSGAEWLGAAAAGPQGPAVESLVTADGASNESARWQWQVLAVSGGFESVAAAGRRRLAAQSPRPDAAPALADVRMSWHPKGSVLAVCMTDSSTSCVAVLAAGSLEPLWHRRWEAECGPTIPAGSVPESPSGVRVAAMSWVRGTQLLALLDDGGNLCLLDPRGSSRAATLLCGAIKYGESALVRLGPILGKAGPLSGSRGAVTDFPRLSAHSGRGLDAACPTGDRRQHQPAPQPPQYSMACAHGYPAAIGSSGVGSGAAPATPLLAICNGDAIALVRLHLCEDEPSTPVGLNCALDAAAYPSPFSSAKVSTHPAVSGGASTGGGGTPGDTPEKDAVPPLPSGLTANTGTGPGLRLELLDPAPSFGSSAVSTPYMLGLQRTGSSAAVSTPLRSCRSNVSDAFPQPSWPIAWRTVLTLPPPTSGASTGAAGWEGVHGSAQWRAPPGSLAGSSVAGRYAPSLGASPSLAGSTGNLLSPSLAAAPPSEATSVGHAGGGHAAAGRDAAAGTDDTGGGGSGLRHTGVCSLMCCARAALRALQQGDVLVLQGSVAEALQHYPRAHIYGFLPAFLALIHLHRVDAAARLLRAYGQFTGQVAAAAAAAAADEAATGVDQDPAAGANRSPREAQGNASGGVAAGSHGSCVARAHAAAALRRKWQATMTGVLKCALAEHAAAEAAASAAAAAAAAAAISPRGRSPTDCGVHGGTSHSARVSRHSLDETPHPLAGRHSLEAGSPRLKVRLPHDRLREHWPHTTTAINAQAHNAPAGGHGLAEADGLAGTRAMAAQPHVVAGAVSGATDRASKTSLLQDGGSGNIMLSVPEEAVLEVGAMRCADPVLVASGAAGGGGGGLPLPPLLLPPVVVEGVPSPKLPDGPEGMEGADAFGAGEEDPGADAEADADVELDFCFQPGEAPPSSPRSLAPAAALQRMLQVCLQLLMLACQAMALVAFSAHGAGRAAAAAAAVDSLTSLSVDPGSPRSPGGGVLSRQAMRRLSSTMRMRSLRTRSVSIYGGIRDGLASAVSVTGVPAGASAAGDTGNSGSGGGASLTRPRITSIASNFEGSLNSQGGGTPGGAAAPRPPPSPPVVIGFPIPVVWQPVPGPPMERTHSASPSRLHGRNSSAAASTLDNHSQSGISTHGGGGGGAHVALMTGTSSMNAAAGNGFAAGGGDGSISLVAFGGASGDTSPSAAPPPPPAMRLELHHCAFDATRLWQDASGQGTFLGQSAAAVYLKPSYAAGLLLMAHACSVQLQEAKRQQQQRREQQQEGPQEAQQAPQSPALASRYAPRETQLAPQQRQRSRMLRAANGCGGARVNWPLLRAAAAATHAAVVWEHLNDWHRAALLAFACANALTQLGGGSADLAAAPPQRRRRNSVLKELSEVEDELLAAPGESMDGAPPPECEAGAAEAGEGGGCSSGALAAARASCLRMGQRVLLSQVGACQKMEVQDACGVLLELVALPRRLLGLHSTVHVSLLQKVCTRVVDLLPKRVCITPLLPAGSVPPLPALSHAAIRQQLLAHCGAAVARVLEELRLAAACGGGFVSLRDTVQQMAEHSTVDSCVRMLLRWQGAYEGGRVDAAAARLAESVQDTMLLPDTADWTAEALLPPLQDAFVVSGLMSASDAAAVAKAALVATADAATEQDDGGDGALLCAAASAGEEPAPTTPRGPAATAAAAAGGGPVAVPVAAGGVAGDGASLELQDLDELALLLDLSQLQHTLLAALQPFLHETLPLLRRQAPPQASPAAIAAAGPSGATDAAATAPVAAQGPGAAADVEDPEEAREDALVDSMLEDPGVISALPPVELAAACLRLLLKLQWALHCRAQVCALMLRLVRLQAPPPAPPPPSTPPCTPPRPHAPPNPAADAGAGTGASSPGHTGLLSVHPTSPSGTAPLPASPATTSPRGFARSSVGHVGHRSFRDYIQHMASEGAAAAAAAAAGVATAAPVSPPVSGAAECGCPTGHSNCTSPPRLPRPASLQQLAKAAHQSGSVFKEGSSVPAGAGQATGQGPGPPPQAVCCGPAQPQGQGVADAQPSSAAELSVAAEMDAVQGALVAWTAALVRADVFHCGSDLQGCVLTVLTVVRSCPLDVTAALDKALRRRSLFNARLAEQVNRLKRSPPPPHPVPAPPEAPPRPQSAATATADAARTASMLPGGAMAPAPSLAPADGSLDLSAAVAATAAATASRVDAPPRGAADGGVVAAGAAGQPLTGFVSGASMSMWTAPPCIAEEGQPSAPLAGPALARDSRSGHDSQPPAATPAVVHVAPVSPQAAVAAAAAQLRSTSLQLLEYYADPSGALPSGLSAAAAGGNTPAQAAGPASIGRPPRPAANAPSKGLPPPPPPSALTATAAGTRNGSAGGAAGSPRASRSAVSRSRAFSRTTSHSTLLQCLVCELVRTAHSVAASVSWRATLEGGRGLASCFVHPALHGASGGTGGGFAAAATAPFATAAGGRPRAASLPHFGTKPGASTGTVEEVPDALGSVPGAEGAQALLLSLLDVTQWAEVGRAAVNGTSGRAGAGAAGSSGAAAAAAFLRRRAATAGGGAPERDALGPAGVTQGAGTASAAMASAAADPAKPGPEGPSPYLTASVAAAGAADAGRSVSGTGVSAGGCEELTAEETAQAIRAARALAAARLRRRCSSPTPPDSPQRSFSTLTDDVDGDMSYPTPTSTIGGAPRSAHTGLGRQGNSSLRQHMNPAFGLHSPTPSNLSEFWDEASELPSPQSSRLGAAAAAAATAVGDSRPSTAGGRHWPGDVSGGGAAAAPGELRLWPGDASTSGAVGGSGILSAKESPQEAAAAASPRAPWMQPMERRAVALGGAEAQAAGPAAGSGASGTEATAVAADAKAAEAGPTGAEEEASEGEQPPTLSYLVNVSTLAEIRNAVREANADAAGSDGAAATAVGAANGSAAAAPFADDAADPDTLPYAGVSARTASDTGGAAPEDAARRGLHDPGRGGSGGGGTGVGGPNSGASGSELSVCGGVMAIISAASARQPHGAIHGQPPSPTYTALSGASRSAGPADSAAGQTGSSRGPALSSPVPSAVSIASTVSLAWPQPAAAVTNTTADAANVDAAGLSGVSSLRQQLQQVLADSHLGTPQAPLTRGHEGEPAGDPPPTGPLAEGLVSVAMAAAAPRVGVPPEPSTSHPADVGGNGDSVFHTPVASPAGAVTPGAAPHSRSTSGTAGILLQDFYREPSTTGMGWGAAAGTGGGGDGDGAEGGGGSPVRLSSEFFATPASRFSAWSGAGSVAFATPATAFTTRSDLPRPVGTGSGALLSGSAAGSSVWHTQATSTVAATAATVRAAGSTSLPDHASGGAARPAWEAAAHGEDPPVDVAAEPVTGRGAAPSSLAPASPGAHERWATGVTPAAATAPAGVVARVPAPAPPTSPRPVAGRAASAHSLRIGAGTVGSAPASSIPLAPPASLHGPHAKAGSSSRLPRLQADAVTHPPGGHGYAPPPTAAGRLASGTGIPPFPTSASSAGSSNCSTASREVPGHQRSAASGPLHGPGQAPRLGRGSHDAHTRRRPNSGGGGGGGTSGGGVNPLFNAGAAVALATLGMEHAGAGPGHGAGPSGGMPWTGNGARKGSSGGGSAGSSGRGAGKPPANGNSGRSGAQGRSVWH